MVEIEIVQDPNELREVLPVVRSAWGMQNADQLVKDTLTAMKFHGGVVLLAKDSGKTVGISFSFPGFKNGHVYLYSHMTGVLEERKYSGTGYRLKKVQEKWALENGYKLIVWTFDPLMSLNANFNMHKIGAISRKYLHNFYGNMEDSLNFGLPTDRFVAEKWLSLDGTSVGNADQSIDPMERDPAVLSVHGDVVGVRIPADFVDMKKKTPDLAATFRKNSAMIFEELFSRGFVVVDFKRNENSYVLSRESGIIKNLPGRIF